MKQDDIRIEMRSDPQMLCAIRGLVQGYGRNLGISSDRIDEVVLAVDEACTNVIRHAYEGRKDGIVQLRLRADRDTIVFELHDNGTPAPIEVLRERVTSEPPAAETIQPGGLGVQLINRVFDSVEFYPGEATGNRVVMRLRRTGKAKRKSKDTHKEK